MAWIIVKESSVFGSWENGRCLVYTNWLRKLPFQYKTERAAKIAIAKRGLNKDYEKLHVSPYETYSHRLETAVTIDTNIIQWKAVHVPDSPSW